MTTKRQVAKFKIIFFIIIVEMIELFFSFKDLVLIPPVIMQIHLNGFLNRMLLITIHYLILELLF